MQFLVNREKTQTSGKYYLKTLFVTKPYESSPPPQRIGQISGGPYMDISYITV